MDKVTTVLVAQEVVKAIRRGLVPLHIAHKFLKWKTDVQKLGIREVRKSPGYHDEGLKGVDAGRRSVRLNQAWRLFYIETETSTCNIIAVKEINKHEYR